MPVPCRGEACQLVNSSVASDYGVFGYELLDSGLVGPAGTLSASEVGRSVLNRDEIEDVMPAAASRSSLFLH